MELVKKYGARWMFMILLSILTLRGVQIATAVLLVYLALRLELRTLFTDEF